MESPANNRVPPWQTEGQEGEPVSFGTWLRRQREIREIPLREIGEVTKISIRYLEALEQDRFDILPAPVFAKGFLREYARYVGLDPDDVINSYLTTQQESAEHAEEEETAGARSTSGSSALVLGGGIVVLLAIVAGLIFYSERFDGEGRAAPPPPIAAPAPPVATSVVVPPAEVTPSTPLLVTMDFTEDCWVEAVVDGERRISELHVQGESMRIEANERVVLTLGNPGGVRIEANGEPFELGVRTDRVARDVVIAVEPPDDAPPGEGAAEGRS